MSDTKLAEGYQIYNAALAWRRADLEVQLADHEMSITAHDLTMPSKYGVHDRDFTHTCAGCDAVARYEAAQAAYNDAMHALKYMCDTRTYL